MSYIEAQIGQAEQLGAEARAKRDDSALLAAVTSTLRAAGTRMLERCKPPEQNPTDLDGIAQALYENDLASLAVTRELLQLARPEAHWIEDELDEGALPNGEFWVVDPVEGNVNHIHGLPEWAISATLVRDNLPVLTAVYEPVSDRLYTALRGRGVARVNGKPLRASRKTELKAAVIATGQAQPNESTETYQRIGQAVTAMLSAAFVVRMMVPATFVLGLVAGGYIDGFWQHSRVRSGLAAGALLVAEAGGIVSDTRGVPWSFASADFLACAPQIHREAVEVLRHIA